MTTAKTKSKPAPTKSPAQKIADLLYEKLTGAELTTAIGLIRKTDADQILHEVGRLPKREDSDSASARKRDEKLKAAGKIGKPRDKAA